MLAPAEASGLALHPGVKGYCRPDLPAHYREKIDFVLWRMVTDRRQKACFSSQDAGLLGLAGGTSGGIFFEGAQRGEEEAGSLPQERFLAANKITLMKLSPVRTTIAHHMVIKNMALAV